MRVFFCLLVMLGTVNSLGAQATTTPVSFKEPGRRNQVAIVPLRLLDLSHQGIEVSYLRRLSPKLGAEISYTHHLPSFAGTMPRNTSDLRGFGVGGELKMYQVARRRRKTVPYYAVEMKYVDMDYRTIHNFSPRDSLENSFEYEYLDSFQVNKQTYALNLKLGFTKTYGRFVVDAYCGLGIKYRDATQTGRGEPRDGYSYRHPYVYQFRDQEEGAWTMNVPLNFRVGYLF